MSSSLSSAASSSFSAAPSPSGSPGARIGSHCKLSNCVIDENVHLPSGTVIGEDLEADRERFFVTGKGVVLVTPDMLGAELNV